jgi:hypothetical protein
MSAEGAADLMHQVEPLVIVVDEWLLISVSQLLATPN